VYGKAYHGWKPPFGSLVPIPMMLLLASYVNGLKYGEVFTGMYLMVPSNSSTLCEFQVGMAHMLLGSTSLLDIKKRKRSLCKVGLIAISTKRMAMTLAEVKINAHLSNSAIVCFSIRLKINHVGTMKKALNNKPKPINVQKVNGFLM
jgi:hypothetical protein